MKEILFFDIEVGVKTKRVEDFGAILSTGEKIHTTSKEAFFSFTEKAYYVCGHNIIKHDLKFLKKLNASIMEKMKIDTLYLSPLLFPSKPYHRLVKDDKLHTEQLNNPLNDSIQAKNLLFDEITAYNRLDDLMKRILFGLLSDMVEFKGFFEYLDIQYDDMNIDNQLLQSIQERFSHKICDHSNLSKIIEETPIELAYCLALINADDEVSITPPWVMKMYPEVDRIIFLLRSNPCIKGCPYCNSQLDSHIGLKDFFGYDSYRSYDGVPLQERAVTAAIYNKSLLAVFPTGGGKSITFQVPALMAGRATKGLTVIISPLQSLMKDQVDNLETIGITDSVAINGLLDPIERSKAIERVEDGSAKILYISPESLRSRSIERLLLGRKIVRFVIDEAHCFSSWGQDFRVDYLYIGEFIKNLCKKKNIKDMIPVSCFTATAKQNVVADIRDYFKEKLGLDLELYTASAARANLHYKVIPSTDGDKYDKVRNIIDSKKCPTIIYVSRTRLALELAERLVRDGYSAKAYHGKMEKQIKIANQDEFIKGDVDIMVATSAFGMGVDKKNVGLVIHYQISDSLEKYVQEAGRAGRDQTIEADCYVLYNDEDLNSHFTLLNQSKLNISEVNQIWKAIKDITRFRNTVSNSALEIARKAGWDENIYSLETRVKTAIATLEQAGYLKRGQNMPRIFANGILASSVMEAAERIRKSSKFNKQDEENSIRIITTLISARSRKQESDKAAESRIDYISDCLGILKKDVIKSVELLKEENILSDTKDLSAYVNEDMSQGKASNLFEIYRELETFILEHISETIKVINIKELNEAAELDGLKKVTTDKVITILNFWTIRHWIEKEPSGNSKNHFRITFNYEKDELKERLQKRIICADFILEYLYTKSKKDKDTQVVEFSVFELKNAYEFENRLLSITSSVEEIENTLFYLSRIGALKIEGGFMVTYNALSIERLELDNRIKYKNEDYKNLSNFYEQRVHKIHIVGEYAKKMLQDYSDALKFVDDYFQLNYQTFLGKYFKASKGEEIQRNITPEKFKQLFADLSPTQLKIINDKTSKYIVVAAGPGSGKTRILVHKLAALLLMEDVKHEQLLMVTFSRAAATEFKKRLKALIGSSANYVDIKTFHSFCFDLLGRVGDIEKSENIVRETARLIKDGEVEISRITKTVMVIDEAQDMDIHEFNLLRAMTLRNENMRVIAVGDDDQNIYSFRGSSAEYMKKVLSNSESKMYELIENYRSKPNLVEFSNKYVVGISNRMKSMPIVAVQKDKGNVDLIRYYHDNMMDGVIKKLLNEGAYGSVCILTRTNDEALQMTGLLLDKGLKAKLIQTNDYFKLMYLDEVKYFINQLEIDDGIHTIEDSRWDKAKYKLSQAYARSEKLSICQKIIQEFEAISGKQKFVSDLKIFLRESRMEDFFVEEHEVILVSTMHKSKGREFDTVIIMLRSYNDSSSEAKRLLYVAMTRARRQLEIHYSGDVLEGTLKDMGLDYRVGFLKRITSNRSSRNKGLLEGCKLREEKSTYKSRSKIVLQLGYADIFLDFFYNPTIQTIVDELRSGDFLSVDEKGCKNQSGDYILRYSKKFKNELENHFNKGFILQKAKIDLIVHWKKEDRDDETKIILPEVHLIKSE